jgi:hypothetical protein
MSLQFSLDFDFSSGYIKKQLENINTLCNAVINAKMIQEKIEDKEFDDNFDNDNIPSVVEKKKSKKKSKSKIVNTKINLLELPDDDEKEPEINIRDIINKEKEDDSNEISVDGETINNKKKKEKKKKADKKVIIVEPSLPKLELPLLQLIPVPEPKVEEKIVSSTKINCICGSSYIKRNEKRHLGTKAHIEFLTLNPNLKK